MHANNRLYRLTNKGFRGTYHLLSEERTPSVILDRRDKFGAAAIGRVGRNFELEAVRVRILNEIEISLALLSIDIAAIMRSRE